MEKKPASGPPELPCLASEQQLRGAVRRLAAEITAGHGESAPLVILGVLKGVVIFLADLVRHLPMPLEIEFVKARSYRGTRQQDIEILDDLDDLDLTGKDVLLLDCVLDTGRTLARLRDEVARREPADVKTCVLLSKQCARLAPVDPEYVGLEVPDVFVVGYGLDHDNRWRHLPYVAELKTEEHRGEEGKE